MPLGHKSVPETVTSGLLQGRTEGPVCLRDLPLVPEVVSLLQSTQGKECRNGKVAKWATLFMEEVGDSAFRVPVFHGRRAKLVD
jgi:hypothetical protein